LPPPHQAETEQRRTEKNQTHWRWERRQRYRRQLASNLTTGEIQGVDVEIGLSALNPRDQRRLGLRDPTLEGDEAGL
jgi:hypothetical protein